MWLTREFKTETQVPKIRHLVPTLCISKKNVSTIHGTSFEKYQSINFGAVQILSLFDSGFGAGRATKSLKMQDCSSTTISVLVLLPLLAVFAVAGNVLVLGIIARFKKFRTFPNILIANLAFMDLLRALIEAPMYLLWSVLNVAWFTGKTFAIISLFVTRLCFHLNTVSMLLLLVNVSMAIALDLKYFSWKTNEKAMKIVLIEWVVCFGGTILLSWFDSDIDLQDASVFSYRRAFLIKSKMVLIVILSVFILTTIAIGVLVFCLIQRKKRQVRSKVYNKHFSILLSRHPYATLIRECAIIIRRGLLKSNGDGGGLNLNYGVGWGSLDVNFFNIEGGLQVILMFEWYIIYSNLTSLLLISLLRISRISRTVHGTPRTRN